MFIEISKQVVHGTKNFLRHIHHVSLPEKTLQTIYELVSYDCMRNDILKCIIVRVKNYIFFSFLIFFAHLFSSSTFPHVSM